MNIVDYNPSLGVAFQGDICFVPLPGGVAFSMDDEIETAGGRLIIQEGELSGHHHAITLERPRQSLAVDKLIADALAGAVPLPSARMYRDTTALSKYRSAIGLTRTDLFIGFLVVEVGPMVVQHEEHDGIRLPVGRYYVGRQIESAGAEERVVAD